MSQSRARCRSPQSRPVSRSVRPRPGAWPREPADLRAAAEEMLREMAFVFHASRSIREGMEPPARPPRPSLVAAALA